MYKPSLKMTDETNHIAHLTLHIGSSCTIVTMCALQYSHPFLVSDHKLVSKKWVCA